MELLPHFGVNGELSKEEFVRRLGRECTADHAGARIETVSV